MNRKHKRQNTQGAEAGFTLLELIIVLTLASILGTFVFSIISKSLAAQINMQTKKEMSDAAVLSLARISRELREAKTIHTTGTGELIFEKKITSSKDTNLFIRYVRNTGNKTLRRQSATTLGSLPSDDYTGKKIALNVTAFNSYQYTQYDSTVKMIQFDLTFEDGSVWQTVVFPMNYGL